MPEINFFWDPLSDNILQERDETGAVTAEYTAEPGLYGNIISQNRGGVESQYHYDAQGSTLAVTDDNQNVTDTFAYAAFGEVTERTGTTDIPFQYIGQKGYYTDSVTGQIMARRRPYEAARARWLSTDSLGVRGHDPNVFTYTRNRPTSVIDPSGKECEAYFPISVLISTTGGKIGSKCKEDDLPEILWDCVMESHWDPKAFAECMERQCGPSQYPKLFVAALCAWLGNVHCCLHLEAAVKKANPCKCGIDPQDPKKTNRPCLNPQKGSAFNTKDECMDCCHYRFCSESVEKACLIALKQKAPVVSLPELVSEALQSSTPRECFAACSDCPDPGM